MQIVLEQGSIDKPLTLTLVCYNSLSHYSRAALSWAKTIYMYYKYIVLALLYIPIFPPNSVEGLHFSTFHLRGVCLFYGYPYFRGVFILWVSLFQWSPYFSGLLISGVSLFYGCPYFSGLLISGVSLFYGCPYFRGVFILWVSLFQWSPYFRGVLILWVSLFQGVLIE